MIKDISNWTGSIVASVIVVTLLEMLLPESKNKKYIKTIMGVYLLFTIISPITKAVAGSNIKLENIIDLNTTSHLAILIPPPAELAQAPINITIKSKSLDV